MERTRGMRRIICSECREYLFAISQEKGNGYAGAIAQQKGFVYKNACLFSTEYSSLFFCDPDCMKAFYTKNISPNPEITKVLKQLKSEIPQMSRECAQGLGEIQRAYKAFIKRKV